MSFDQHRCQTTFVETRRSGIDKTQIGNGQLYEIMLEVQRSGVSRGLSPTLMSAKSSTERARIKTIVTALMRQFYRPPVGALLNFENQNDIDGAVYGTWSLVLSEVFTRDYISLREMPQHFSSHGYLDCFWMRLQRPGVLGVLCPCHGSQTCKQAADDSEHKLTHQDSFSGFWNRRD